MAPSARSRPPTGWAGWRFWNLVFMQFERSLGDGPATPRPLPKPWSTPAWGSSAFRACCKADQQLRDRSLCVARREGGGDQRQALRGPRRRDDDVSMRVIADHARTTAFLIAEGVFPDRAGREYVLRRVMRRAIRHGHRLGIKQPFLHEVAEAVVQLMGDAYPELERAQGAHR